MKAPAFNHPCRACGRDMVNGACSVCDAEVGEPRQMSPSERVFRCVERNPGQGTSELAELLGDEDEKSVDCLIAHLSRLTRKGALRAEGGRNDRVYYAVDQTKLPWRASPGTAPKKSPKAKRALKRYHFLIREKRCTTCGSKHEQGWKGVQCATCQERRNEQRRRERIEEGRCTACKCEMLPEWRLFKQCPECREKHATRRMEWRQKPEVKARLHAKQKVRDIARHQRLKAQGLCHDCESPSGGNFRCDDCKRIANAANVETNRERRKRRLAAGICPCCGKVPLAEQRTACVDCLKRNIRNQMRMRERRQERAA